MAEAEQLPAFAVHKVAKLGKMAVVHRLGKDGFMCRDVHGNMRIFHRDNLTFTNK